MTTPQPPQSDTDRIIAAQREEARKTRQLLVWIFVGLPVVGLCIWGLVALASRPSDAGNGGSADAGYAADTTTSDAALYATAPPPTWTGTPNAAAVQSFTVTDTTMCSAIDDWYDTNAGQGPIDPADAPIYQGAHHRAGTDAMVSYLATKHVTGEAATQDAERIEWNCANGPDETILAALGHAP